MLRQHLGAVMTAGVATVELDASHPLEGLTGKAYQFAKTVFSGTSYAEAYRMHYNCGAMSERDIARKAQELAKDPLVTAKIRQLRLASDAATTLPAALTREWITKGIMDLAVNGDKDSVRLEAYKSLGKTAGIDLFRETTRVEHVNRTPEQVDQELQAKLKELAATIDGTARDVTAKPADRRRKPKAPSAT